MSREDFLLYDPTNSEERALLSKFAQACLKNSRYDFVAGGTGNNFVDIDEYSAGREGKEYNTDAAPEMAEQLAQYCADKIVEVQQEKGVKIERLAFIERDTGPVGMITYKDFVGAKTRIETCCVRPRKRLLPSVLKGRPLRPGENIALITDVATSGDTILAAADKIWQLGGVVSCAIVVYDRSEGAREYLDQYDIDLFPIWNREKLSDEGHLAEQPLAEQPRAKAKVMQFVGMGATR